MSKTNIRWNRWGLVAGAALAAFVLRSATTAYGFANTEAIQNDSGESESELNLYLEGDQTSNIDLGNSNDFINPFGPDGTQTDSYDATSNTTTVEFGQGSGSPIANEQDAEVGITDSQDAEIDGKGWGAAENPPPNSTDMTDMDSEVPVPTIEATDEGSGPDSQWVIVDEETQFSDGDSSTDYYESQVVDPEDTQIEISNDAPSNGPIILSDIGFQLSPTQIPLDDLNNNDYPPSSFNPVTGISNDSQLNPGNSVESSDLPEPAPLGILLVGGGLGLLRRRRK